MFATAARQVPLPVARSSPRPSPGEPAHHEHEPDEALALLAKDEIDLAVVYDYDLAPATFRDLVILILGSTRWSLGVPSDPGRGRGTAASRRPVP